jgi:hypothetical protein
MCGIDGIAVGVDVVVVALAFLLLLPAVVVGRAERLPVVGIPGEIGPESDRCDVIDDGRWRYMAFSLTEATERVKRKELEPGALPPAVAVEPRHRRGQYPRGTSRADRGA